MKLIASLTSPFARKIRVQLLEKDIEFELHETVPWDADSDIVKFNPLGKVPALIDDQGTVWTDSAVIARYLETLNQGPRLIPEDPMQAVEVQQWEALAEGVLEAGIAIFLERKREPGLQSTAWIERQQGKLDRGLAYLSDLVADRHWLNGYGMTIADISLTCTLQWLRFRFPQYNWPLQHENLARYGDLIDARESFVKTRPPQ